MRNVILIGGSILFGIFVLFGMQRRAEAPLAHPSLDAVSVSTVTEDELSLPNDIGRKSSTLFIGSTTISALLAVTEEERILGLGNRGALSLNAGMLFIFPQRALHGIWMKDMRFPLDIIWLAPSDFPKEKLLGLVPIDSDARKLSGLPESLVVVDMKENIKPETYPKVFSPLKSASYVLEMNGGAASRNGIRTGSVLMLEK